MYSQIDQNGFYSNTIPNADVSEYGHETPISIDIVNQLKARFETLRIGQQNIDETPQPTITVHVSSVKPKSSKGLSKQFMALIKNMKMGNSSRSCSVCMQGFSKDQIIKRLPCGHIFHRNCAKSWLKINITCPNCRLNLVEHFTKQAQDIKQNE